MAIAGLISTRSRLGVRRGRPTRRIILDPNYELEDASAGFEVRMLSSNGILLQTEADLSMGEPLAVQHQEVSNVVARVVWEGDGLVACTFSRRLSNPELARIKLNSGRTPTISRTGSECDMTEARETLGRRIKQRRKDKGYSMVHFANIVGVSKPTLWRWETDTVLPAAESLRKIARELGATEFDLLYGIPHDDHSEKARQSGRVESGNEQVSDKLAEIAKLLGVERDRVQLIVR